MNATQISFQEIFKSLIYGISKTPSIRNHQSKRIFKACLNISRNNDQSTPLWDLP